MTRSVLCFDGANRMVPAAGARRCHRVRLGRHDHAVCARAAPARPPARHRVAFTLVNTICDWSPSFMLLFTCCAPGAPFAISLNIVYKCLCWEARCQTWLQERVSV